MIILDGSIVTVALPAIQQDLGFTQSGLVWVVNAYLIAFADLLFPATEPGCAGPPGDGQESGGSRARAPWRIRSYRGESRVKTAP